MRFENFDLSSPCGGIELTGLGHHWDLHNFADFNGFRFLPAQDEIWMEWTVPTLERNPWGSPGNSARACRLRFVGVTHFVMGARDRAYPLTESDCLESVSKAVPGELEHPFKDNREEDESFHLRFEFQDERRLDIGADRVVLEAVFDPGGERS